MALAMTKLPITSITAPAVKTTRSSNRPRSEPADTCRKSTQLDACVRLYDQQHHCEQRAECGAICHGDRDFDNGVNNVGLVE